MSTTACDDQWALPPGSTDIGQAIHPVIQDRFKQLLKIRVEGARPDKMYRLSYFSNQQKEQ